MVWGCGEGTGEIKNNLKVILSSILKDIGMPCNKTLKIHMNFYEFGDKIQDFGDCVSLLSLVKRILISTKRGKI